MTSAVVVVVVAVFADPVDEEDDDAETGDGGAPKLAAFAIVAGLAIANVHRPTRPISFFGHMCRSLP